MSATSTETGISLAVAECETPACQEFAAPLFMQLSSGKYDRCSVMEIPNDIVKWRDDHKTARKRASRAWVKGYEFGQFDPSEYVDDIHSVNTSKSHRQGRPMSESYTRRPTFAKDDRSLYGCARHAVYRYGVFSGGRLVAYTFIYRAGELALVSTILGHGDYLDDGIMFLLMQQTLMRQKDLGGFMVYNRHDSGTDGLRQFKEWIGFEEREVRWLP